MNIRILALCAFAVFTAQLPKAQSGVLMLTSKGISYLNQDQLVQDKDMIEPAPGQDDWSRQEPQVLNDEQDDDEESEPDDEEPESDDDVEPDDEEEEADDIEQEKTKDKEEEEDETEDENETEKVPKYKPKPKRKLGYTTNKGKPVKESAEVEGDEEEEGDVDDDREGSEEDDETEPRTDKEAHMASLKDQKKYEKLKAQNSEEEDDDEKRPPPPPPAELLEKMQYSQMMSQYEPQGIASATTAGGPSSAPILSRMTSLLSSLFNGGRGSVPAPSDQFSGDPFYSSRGAKSVLLSAQRSNSKVSKEPTVTQEAVLSRKRRASPLNMAQLSITPFYHVRNNIRTLVRRQPVAKLVPRPPQSDFTSINLSEKASKPIKLNLEPYSAPNTLQNPPAAPLSPAEGLRGPGSAGTSSGTSPGGLGSPGQGGSGRPAPATPNNSGGNKEGGQGGNKKNSGGNKKNNNRVKDEDKDSEEGDGDSDEDGENSSGLSDLTSGEDPFENEIPSVEDEVDDDEDDDEKPETDENKDPDHDQDQDDEDEEGEVDVEDDDEDYE